MENKFLANMNWEKVGVYIAALALFFIFAAKVNDLGERISKLEGQIELIIPKIQEKK